MSERNKTKKGEADVRHVQDVGRYTGFYEIDLSQMFTSLLVIRIKFNPIHLIKMHLL